MKISQQQLRKLIKEEISKALKEASKPGCSKKDLKDIRRRKERRRQSIRIGHPESREDSEAKREECLADRKQVKRCGWAWSSEGDYC
tara:strand:+ start:389 stop:649 length:261 start_codon:yes stop_codon:yes gene_type:complete